MRRKRRFFACAILCLVMSLMVQTTQAYFATYRVAHNVISSGGIDIVLHEETDGGKPFQNLTGIMPGESVTKKVYIENLDEEAWIRIRCDVRVLDAKGKDMNLTDSDLAKVIHIDYNTKDWGEKDGIWYHFAPLGRKGKTAPLFTTVAFDGPGMTNEYQNCTVQIIVQAQATQKVHNGNDVFSAAVTSWPQWDT